MNKIFFALTSVLLLTCGCTHHAFVGNASGSAEANHMSPMDSASAHTSPTVFPTHSVVSSARNINLSTCASTPVDVEINQSIRRSVVNDDTMSVNAQNVCVQTNGGHVMLSGAVDDDDESARLMQIAQKTPGVVSVENWLQPLTKSIAATQTVPQTVH